MALLLPNLRQVLKFGAGIKDRATGQAIRALENWADELVRRLSLLEESVGGGGITLPIAMSDVTGLVAALAGKVATSLTLSGTSPVRIDGGASGDLSANRTISVLDNSTSDKGVVAVAPNDTSKFWRGDATWGDPVLGDWVFGSGADGPVTFDGVSTVLGIVPSGGQYILNRDINATDLTCTGGAIIRAFGYRIFATGTITGLDMRSQGNGASAGTGGSTGSATAGFLGGSTAGGNASNGAGTAHTAGIPVIMTTATGNNRGAAGGVGNPGGAAPANTTPFRGGGAGGDGNSANNGGNGGGITITAATNGGPTLLALIQGHPEKSLTSWQFGTGGGAGGNAGGGGGGGCIVCCAPHLVNCSLVATGGNGANSGANSGGGPGGGGGGLIIMVYRTKSSVTTNVSGGTAGLAGTAAIPGGAGANGAAGLVIDIPI